MGKEGCGGGRERDVEGGGGGCGGGRGRGVEGEGGGTWRGEGEGCGGGRGRDVEGVKTKEPSMGEVLILTDLTTLF